MNAATVKCGQDPNQEVGHAHGQQAGRLYTYNLPYLDGPLDPMIMRLVGR